MSAVGAFLAAAAVVDQTKGEIVFLGTPAEEGGGGKIKMLEGGVFEGIDAAMMFHPFARDMLAHPSLATTWLTMTFHGEPAHAAAAPHDGKSALQACMDTFRLMDGQRVRFRDGVRVHGYITNGGQAVNIIPELASCEFSVRARDAIELERIIDIVERCARGAALASEATLEITRRTGYSVMVNNMAMARVFGHHLDALGRKAPETDGARRRREHGHGQRLARRAVDSPLPRHRRRETNRSAISMPSLTPPRATAASPPPSPRPRPSRGRRQSSSWTTRSAIVCARNRTAASAADVAQPKWE